MKILQKVRTKTLFWNKEEEKKLVEYIALHSDQQTNPDAEWPAMRAGHPYWDAAAQFVSEHTGKIKREGKFSFMKDMITLIRPHYHFSQLLHRFPISSRLCDYSVSVSAREHCIYMPLHGSNNMNQTNKRVQTL